MGLIGALVPGPRCASYLNEEEETSFHIGSESRGDAPLSMCRVGFTLGLCVSSVLPCIYWCVAGFALSCCVCVCVRACVIVVQPGRRGHVLILEASIEPLPEFAALQSRHFTISPVFHQRKMSLPAMTSVTSGNNSSTQCVYYSSALKLEYLPFSAERLEKAKSL